MIFRLITSILLTTCLFCGVFAGTCEYPSGGAISRTFERLQADQKNDLIPKLCNNGDGCGNSAVNGDVCARDPAILTTDVGCSWCTSKDADTCDPDPSDQVTDDDYYNCYSTTTESCGCIDNRAADVVVLVDSTTQTANSFNYYLLFFTWWFSERILPQTPDTNLHYIFFTDKVVYSGDEPYDHFGFEVEDPNVDVVQPKEMTDLPDEIDGADQPNLCPAMEEAMAWLDDQDDLKPNLMFYLPTTSLDPAALNDCRDADDDQLLNDVATFALRFYSDTNIAEFEDQYEDLDYCDYFQDPTWAPASAGNTQETRYLVNLLSEFICAAGGDLTLEPTTNPTQDPTSTTTEEPTSDPTEIPTQSPTAEPTKTPSTNPTREPSEFPTNQPSEEPTAEPTDDPTIEPTENPTQHPTETPTEEPTDYPTEYPSEHPSFHPTEQPTEEPTEVPTEDPTTLEPTPWWHGHKKHKQPWWAQQRQVPKWQNQPRQDPWWTQQRQEPWWNQDKRHDDGDERWWRDHNDDGHHDRESRDWYRRYSSDDSSSPWSDSSSYSDSDRVWKHRHSHRHGGYRY